MVNGILLTDRMSFLRWMLNLSAWQRFGMKNMKNYLEEPIIMQVTFSTREERVPVWI